MNTPSTSDRRVLVVRHAAVAEKYAELCYGRSDIELSDEGLNRTDELAEELSRLPITHLYYSPLCRSALLGQRIVVAPDAHVAVVPELQEIHFGDWELRNWEDIYAEAPDALDRMIAEPKTYAAPGGETLWSVRERVMSWYNALPARGLIVAVTHGGPIAVLRGTLGGLSVDKWFALVPNHGEIIELESTPPSER